MASSFRDLVAWQKALDLVEAIYAATEGFPKQEIYGLTAQMKRAVVSIPSNIAEGQGRRSTNEFIHFLGNARGSLLEIETQVEIAYRLKFIGNERKQALLKNVEEVARILNGLINSLEAKGKAARGGV